MLMVFDSNASMPVWFQSSGRGYGWWAAASPLGWWTSLIDDTCNNSEWGGPQAKCMSGGTHQHLLQSSCWSTLSGRQEHQGCQFSLDRQPTCTTCVQNKIRQTINIIFFMCLFLLISDDSKTKWAILYLECKIKCTHIDPHPLNMWYFLALFYHYREINSRNVLIIKY